MDWDEKQFRSALGRFATGVCVVSAMNPMRQAIGMTINSFSSVSLNPSLIQWNLKSDSLTYRLFNQISCYSISVLSNAQLEISKRYARSGDHVMLSEDCVYSPRGIPFVKNSLAHFECSSWQSYAAGDHHIIIAAVEGFVANSQEEPLVFFKGSYRALMEAHAEIMPISRETAALTV